MLTKGGKRLHWAHKQQRGPRAIGIQGLEAAATQEVVHKHNLHPSVTLKIIKDSLSYSHNLVKILFKTPVELVSWKEWNPHLIAHELKEEDHQVYHAPQRF